MKRLWLLPLLMCTAMAFGQTATGTVGTPLAPYKLAPASTAGYLLIVNGTNNATVPGLSYSNLTGILSGTPTTAGTYVVKVENGSGAVTGTVTLTVSVSVPVVTPPVTTPPPAATCTGSSPCVNVTCTYPSATASTTAYVYVAVFVQTGTGVPSNTAATIVPCTATATATAGN